MGQIKVYKLNEPEKMILSGWSKGMLINTTRRFFFVQPHFFFFGMSIENYSTDL